MNHIIKNIILIVFVSVCFILVFSDSGKALHAAPVFSPTSYICPADAPSKTENSGPSTELVQAKKIFSVLKVEIQPGIIIPFDQVLGAENYFIVKSDSPYRLSPQIVYVRYLPRDPPVV